MIFVTRPHDLSAQALGLVERLHRAEVPLPEVPPESSWTVADVPEELQRRKVELVVPANDGPALRAAVQARPDALVLDFDDTFSPTWVNVLAGHHNLEEYGASCEGVLMLRPRGLHLCEGHVWVDGEPVSAAVFDLAAGLTALAPRLRAGQHVYLYLPKIETPQDARRWQTLITEAERDLELPENGVRVGIQIESFGAALAADDVLYQLRERAFGLNAGRWDYFCSLLKAHPEKVLPERAEMHLGSPSLSAYARLIVHVARRHGAQAIGGNAALVPDAGNPKPVLERVRADKQLEAALGFEAAWAGHPALVDVVRDVFQTAPAADPGEAVLEADLLELDAPTCIREAAVRDTIALALDYLEAWRRGEGNLERGGRLEDMATVEFARAQLWQWTFHRCLLDDGSHLTSERYLALREEAGEGLAASWLDDLVLASKLPAFFARELYPALLEVRP